MEYLDYFKQTYLCGVFNGAETGTDGMGTVALLCLAYGNSYQEVIDNYIENVRILYPFWDCDFTCREGQWLCDGRSIIVFKVECNFYDHSSPYIRIEEVYNPKNIGKDERRNYYA